MRLFRFRKQDITAEDQDSAGSAEGFEAPLTDKSDIDLQKTDNGWILHFGTRAEFDIVFEDTGPDYFFGPRARNMGEDLVESGVTKPSEVYRRVKAFVDQSRRDDPEYINNEE